MNLMKDIDLKNIDASVILDKQRTVFPVITLFLALIIANNIHNAQKAGLADIKVKIKEEGEISRLVKDIKQKEAKFSQAKKGFAVRESAEVMREISEIAAKNGIKLISLSPGQERVKTGEFFKSLPFSARINGSYHQIGDFVSGIESSDYVLKITQFQLVGSRSEKEVKESLKADLTIDAVFLTER